MFTFFHGCGIPPVTLTCPQGGHAQAQAQLGPTGTQGCTATAPPNCLIGPTGTQGCTQPGHCVGPTGTYGCTIVGPTGTQGCTQPQTVLPPTWFGNCGIPPVTVTCQQAGHAQAQNVVPNTIGCTAITPCATFPPNTAPPHCVPNTVGCTAITPCPTLPCPPAGNAHAQTIGITGWQGCTVVGPTGTQGCTVVGPTGTQGCTVVGPTGYQGCGQHDNAQAQNVGPTGYQGCHQQNTLATVCTQIDCGPTHLLGCTGYEGCLTPTGTPPATVCPGGDAQAQTLGHTAYEGCGQHGTEATVCTQIGCGPTHLLGCTGYEGCHNGGNAQAQVHSIPVANCIPTRSCTGAWPVC